VDFIAFPVWIISYLNSNLLQIMRKEEVCEKEIICNFLMELRIHTEGSAPLCDPLSSMASSALLKGADGGSVILLLPRLGSLAQRGEVSYPYIIGGVGIQIKACPTPELPMPCRGLHLYVSTEPLNCGNLN
jgi:hypothetical protein